MGTLTFLDDTIIGLPGTGSTTTSLIVAPDGNNNYTFNPFATTGSFAASAVVSDAGGTADVTLRLIFSDSANPGTDGNDDGMTLFNYVGGSFVQNAGTWQGVGGSYAAVAQGSTFFSTGSTNNTAQQVEGWLQTLYVIGWDINDTFRLQIRGMSSLGVAGSTYIQTYTIACFMQGTMIGTPAGERSVEALQAGDLVTTLDGSAKKVKWIGHRTYEAEFGAGEAFVRPVLFRAGSLGGGLPTRDLKVSPQHAMLIDGVMVPAGALVNGVSIVRDTTLADVTYFHVELDSHEAIFAEGAATETFVDHNSRAMFDNADEHSLLYGNAATDVQQIARLEEGFQLAAIRATLADIAGIPAMPTAGKLQGNLERLEDGMLTGWVIDSAGADAVEAEMLVGGEVVARVVANRYRADLDQAGLGGGRGGFTVALPGSVDSLAQVSLRRVVDGQMLAGAVLELATV